MLPTILQAASSGHSTPIALQFSSHQGEHGQYRVARGHDGADYGYGPIDGRDRLWRRTAEGVVQTLSPACNTMIAERFLDLVNHRTASEGHVLQARWPVLGENGERSIETVPVVVSRTDGGLTIAALAIGAGKVEVPAGEVEDFLVARRPGRVSDGVAPRAQSVFDEQLLALVRMAPGVLSPGENLRAAFGQTRIRMQMGGQKLHDAVDRRLTQLVDTLARGLDGQRISSGDLSRGMQLLSDLMRGRAAEAIPGHVMALVVAELEPAHRACGAIYAASIDVKPEAVEADTIDDGFRPR